MLGVTGNKKDKPLNLEHCFAQYLYWQGSDFYFTTQGYPKIASYSLLIYTTNKMMTLFSFYGEVSGVSHPEERSYTVVWWCGSGYFCICCQRATDCFSLFTGMRKIFDEHFCIVACHTNVHHASVASISSAEA